MPGEQFFVLVGIFLLLSAAGWSLRYLWERDRPREPGQYLNVEYLKGLNFLLNEQTDQAVDLFLRMVRVDDETIETHFALGSLFRRRGEVDRAIRIHQNIIARPNLPAEQRDQALYALAKDYLKAGLLDRAESLFRRLIDETPYKEEGLDFLCRIYEQERDWPKAIEAARELERLRGPEMSLTVAHYYCELAQAEIEANDYASARQHLRDAQAGRSRTERGTLARGELAEQTGDLALALKLYRRTMDQNPDLAVEVLPRLARVHEKAGTPAQFNDEVAAFLTRKPEAERIVAYTAILHPELQGDALGEAVEHYIESEPTLTEFMAVGALCDIEGAERERVLARIKKGLSNLAAKTPTYRCRECGFSSMSLQWQCPGCREWETQRPADQVRFDSLVRGNAVDW